MGEGKIKEEDQKIKALILKATRDIEFRDAFLKDPITVGKTLGVSFTPAQLNKIKRTAEFIASIQDRLVDWPIPRYTGYPMDNYLVRWEFEEMFQLITERLPRRRFPPHLYVYYPAPPWGFWRERMR